MHQEKEKQHAAPFWRLKCNIDAQIQVSKEQSFYKQEWMERHQHLVGSVCDVDLNGLINWWLFNDPV